MSLVHFSTVSYSYPCPDLDGSPFDEGPAPSRNTIEQLRDITLSLEAGTVTLFVGASGSGKSTLLRCLNGLVPHFFGGTLTGRVEVSGTDLADVALHDMGRTSAMIFQNPRTQFFTPTVRTELAFGLENYGVPPADIRAAVEHAAHSAGVTHLINRRLDSLSGGELQRVACACALVADVDLLLFDEPTSNLSAEAIDDFRTLIASLREAGRTLVIAEHRLHLFRDLVDTVHVVDAGRIVDTMTGEELFALSDDERRSRGLRSLEVPAAHAPAPPDDAPGLTIENLRFAYRHGPRILDIDRLAFPSGAVTVLAGPNGAGKSTLARLVCGVERTPSGARIGVGGPWTPRQRRNRSGMVMQDVRRQLFSESVEHEVTVGLSAQGKASVDVAELLRRLDLEGVRARHPLSLSGGQAQRLVVATTVASGAEVIFVDEPTSGVDYRHLIAIADLLRDLAASGAIVIVITHDPELVARCGDYLVTLTPATTSIPQGAS